MKVEAVIAASLFDHPGFLLLLVFAALVRWLVSRAKQTQNTQSPLAPPSRPISRGGETQTEEERVRRFLEALGQPPGTTPPKVITQRRGLARPDVFSPLPPLKTKPPPLPKLVVPPPPAAFETTRVTPVPASESSFGVRDVARQTSSEPSPETRRAAGPRFDPRFKLGTPQDLRAAIVLREIFGPPRSLQPPDLSSVA